jgi:pimeloyl-ACP methyl ester carboxylesterase
MKATVEIGGPVYVERVGSGPPMVLVHGLGSSHVHWLGVSPALARTHRLHMPDLPGFGLTPLAGRSPSVEANAALLERFLERLRRPAVVVGNSMGALLAMLVASDRPELVSALVLAAPPAPRPPLAPLEPRIAALFSAYTWPVLGEMTRDLWVRLKGPEGMVRDALEICCAAPDAVPAQVLEAAHRVARERAHADEVHAFLGAYRSMWRYLLSGRRFDSVLRRITAPALVVQGTEDRLIPDVVRERLRRTRPDWKYMTVEGAGHMPQLDDAAGFAALVSGWLLDLGRRRRAG